LTLSLIATFLIFRGVDPSPLISTNILLLTLINVNITLIVVLLLLLSRNLIKLFFEKRQKWLGFKRKLIAAFIGLSIIPCILLFVVASGLLTSSIENWFSIHVERSLDASLEVAQTYYTEAQKTTEQFAKQIGLELQENPSLKDNPARLRAFLKAKAQQYHTDALHLLTPKMALILSTGQQSDWLVGAGFPFPLELTGKTVEPGKPITTITTSPQGDLMRVALISAGNMPIVVVDRLIPIAFLQKMERIKKESEEYKQLKVFENPIKASYLLSFFIVVLLIVFSATWFGVYLARGITIPIEKLAEGTAAVAQGNLDYQIPLTVKDELGTLVASFNKMTHDLKQSREALVRAEKIATWQEVALQMAHEIKNPLTPIQLATERLRKKYFERAQDLDKIFDESTQTVINEVQGLTALVNEFSNFARLPPVHLVHQKIEPILEEVVRLYQSGHKEIAFQMQLSETLPLLRLDRDQMKRVFVNLFENAVEAAPQAGGGNLALPLVGLETTPAAAGQIFISAVYDVPAQQVRVEVADNGHGIAPEDMDKVFLPHFSRKRRGSGLGLAIVHRIVLDHGGQIFVSPQQPKGTLFTLLLPTL
jgi:nitrogen fixation/metabolism regulation signal transduction histidine kinase